MHVWIVRHGKAETHAPEVDDWVRRLTARGERQARFLAERLAAHRLRPALVLSSPVTRAATTARPIAAALGLEPLWAPALETERPVSAGVALLQEHARTVSLALVGHNYQLSELLGALVSGQPGIGEGDLAELRTGEAALVTIDAQEPLGSGELVERVRLED